MAVKRKVKKSVEDDVITYQEAYEMFIQEKEAMNLSKATLRDYRLNLKIASDYFEFTDETPVNAITLPEIYRYINHLKNVGVAPATVQTYVRTLRCFVYWCMDENRRYIDPAYKIKLPKAQEEQIKFYNDEEVAALLERPKRNATFNEWRSWAITNWILATGNRASTVLDTRVGDIDFKRKEIILHHTKNGKAQIVPLSSTLEIVIKEYIRLWRKDVEDDAYLFPNIGDEKLGVNSLGAAFKRYCLDRGVTKTSVHGLRHTFARMWVKNNGNLFQLQKLLGHSTLDMTKRYARLFGEDLKDDFDKYSPLDTMSRKNKRTNLVKR